MQYDLKLSDALDFLRAQPDNAYDIGYTDPPYGIGETNNRNLTRGNLCRPTDYGEHTWDENKIPDEYFVELRRVCRHWIVFGGNYYAHVLGSCDGPIIWDKENGKTHFADAEIAWTNIPGAARIYRYRWQGMLQANMQQKERRIYPTQKPVPLATRILRDYAEPEWSVLDPFMGSGALLEAALRLGMRAHGCDVSPQALEIAGRRLREYAAQPDLYGAQELWANKPPRSKRGADSIEPESGTCAKPAERAKFPDELLNPGRTKPDPAATVSQLREELREQAAADPLPGGDLYDELFGGAARRQSTSSNQ